MSKHAWIVSIAASLGAIVLSGCPGPGPDGPPGGGDPLAGVAYRELIGVPGGTFTQVYNTSSFTNTVSAFRLAKYEVTYELWYTVKTWAAANGYTFIFAGCQGQSPSTAGTAPTEAGKLEPVTFISWRDAVVWCNAYSRMEGLAPVYYYDAELTNEIKWSSSDGGIMGAIDHPHLDPAADGYRLPTEGEWHCAASYINGVSWQPYNYAAGAATYFDDVRDLDEDGVYDGKEANDLVAVYGDFWDGTQYQSTGPLKTMPVGGKQPNQLGLYDLSGNVYEMCWDWSDVYPTAAQTNYQGGAEATGFRVARGGYFNGEARTLAVGFRFGVSPNISRGYVGFRVARKAAG